MNTCAAFQFNLFGNHLDCTTDLVLSNLPACYFPHSLMPHWFWCSDHPTLRSFGSFKTELRKELHQKLIAVKKMPFSGTHGNVLCSSIKPRKEYLASVEASLEGENFKPFWFHIRNLAIQLGDCVSLLSSDSQVLLLAPLNCVWLIDFLYRCLSSSSLPRVNTACNNDANVGPGRGGLLNLRRYYCPNSPLSVPISRVTWIVS